MESKEQTRMATVKGKRRKRQRTQSPSSFSLASHSLKEEDGGGFDESGNDDIKTGPSPSSSHVYSESCTEEEEDMAKCLILLSYGQSVARDSKMELADRNHGNLNIQKTSKRFLETAAIGDGKVGFYVYVCRTCNRTFPSFQALGGHRASHKKHNKPNYVAEIKKIHNYIGEKDTEDERYKDNNSEVPLQFSYNNIQIHNEVQHNTTTRNHSNNNNNNNKENNNKVHECGICGAEFNSGQALGGHMRRHRGATCTTSTTLSLSPMATESTNEDKSKTSEKVLSLELDLNLPAPEDDKSEIGPNFASKQQQEQQDRQQQPKQQQQQQQVLVFPSAALVNCQY